MRSRTSSVSPSSSPPEFFIDRSLGRRIVPAALRERGVKVHTMAEVYGERIGQGLDDETWLADAGRADWVVLMKDDRIRYRPAELDALVEHGVRAFCLTNANLRGEEQAARIVASLQAIADASSEPGPYVVGIYATGLRRLWPRPDR